MYVNSTHLVLKIDIYVRDVYLGSDAQQFCLLNQYHRIRLKTGLFAPSSMTCKSGNHEGITGLDQNTISEQLPSEEEFVFHSQGLAKCQRVLSNIFAQEML